MKATLNQQVDFFKLQPGAAKQFLSVGSYPRNEDLDETQHAALAAVCLAILNFDEALTRE